MLTDQSQNFVTVMSGINIKSLLKKSLLGQSGQAELQIPGIVVNDYNPSTIAVNPTLAIAVNTNTNMIYVANYDSNTTSVIDGETDKVVDNIKVGKSPTALAFDEITNKIYVANYDSNTISVIDGKTVVDNITLNNHPSAIIANPDTDKIYVINGQNTISVINATTDKVVDNIFLSYTLDSIMIDN